MFIYNDSFKDYIIKPHGVDQYKVYLKKQCVKNEVFKELRSGVIKLTEDDYNEYLIRVATVNTLLQALVYIFEANSVYKQHSKDVTTVKAFYDVLSEFQTFITAVKTQQVG